ncbi:MAG: hypothetical protein JXB49_03670 [Bacteroidales bacterium]|nr:hypothetical protein [Bacteroidales bacterium]
MKRKVSSIIVILTCAFSHVYGQLNTYDLSNYKLPDLKRHSLEINLDATGNNYFKKIINYNPYNDPKYKSNEYYGNISLNYRSYINNTFLQHTSDVGSSFYFNYDKNNNNYKGYSLLPDIYARVENRIYILSNFYVEADIDTRYGYDYYYRKNDNIFYKSKSHNFIGYVPLKTGIGRIEQVQDARHAIYIYDELSKQERTSADKTDEDVTQLAYIISRLKNKRFFDTRIRKIYEIEAIDSFLQDNSFVTSPDARYFTTLNDIWVYGNGPIRSSGICLAFAIYPGYYRNDYSNEDFYEPLNYTDDDIYAFLLKSGVEFIYDKPLNLYWQNSLGINGYAGIMDGRYETEEIIDQENFRIPNIVFAVNEKIGYYPNTRTYAGLYCSSAYAQFFDATDLKKDIRGFEGKGIRTYAGLSVNYYITPQLRLNINSSLYHIWQNSDDNANISTIYLADTDLPYYHAGDLMNFEYREKEISHRFTIKLTYSIL